MNSFADKLLLLMAIAAAGILLAYAYIYQQIDARLVRVYEVPLTAVPVSDDPAVIAEGERQAWIHGCFWCHGDNLEGRPYFINGFRGVEMVAPNLTDKARDYSVEELARAIRNGIKADGTSLQPAMPSFAFYHMSDEQLGALISYIRSVPETDGYEGGFKLWPMGVLRAWQEKLPPNLGDLIDHSAPRVASDYATGSAEQGQYLVESVCTECHSDNGRLRVPGSPDLGVARAYDKENFMRLMRTGVALAERPIDYHMAEVSKYRYIYFSDAEMDAIYKYLIGQYQQ